MAARTVTSSNGPRTPISGRRGAAIRRATREKLWLNPIGLPVSGRPSAPRTVALPLAHQACQRVNDGRPEEERAEDETTEEESHCSC
jgi:hypothetical protein